MEIRKNVMYRFSTKEHYDNFMAHVVLGGSIRAIIPQEYIVGIMVFVYGNGEIVYTYQSRSEEVVEWKIGFSKANMQIGQMYKTRNGRICTWSMEDVGYYTNALMWSGCGSQEDIIEVYPFPLTPLWKCPEPKYRLKGELTREQAEKLGLELCEVIE